MFAFIRRSMMSRLVALVGICLFTSGAEFSCSSDGTGRITDRDLGSGSGPRFTTTLVLRDSAGTATRSFDRGELITLELTVRNRTDQSVRLNNGHPPDFEFFVIDDGTSRVRWQYTENRAFPAVILPIDFAAGETKTYTFTWNQVLRDGAMLERGNYEARGAIPFPGLQGNPLAADELGSNLLAFTVR